MLSDNGNDSDFNLNHAEHFIPNIDDIYPLIKMKIRIIFDVYILFFKKGF